LTPRVRTAPLAAVGAVFASIGLLAGATTALAHEPLWGETPTIFGPHVWHPEIRFASVHRGDAGDPGGESFRELNQVYALQYGINRFVNLKLTMPAVRTDVEQNLAGESRETRVSGIGDALLAAKVRFRVRQETGFQTSQALVAAWKVPTGDHDREGPDGMRLMPADQPGSGKHGVVLGYAADVERLVDSAWTSVFYSHDFGDGFRRGDMLEVDAAYGRWVVRPNVADDLGLNLAFGIHAEAMADDRLEDDTRAGNEYRVAGIQVTPIVSKGRAQYRFGVFVPLIKWGDDLETDYGYEIRAGWEMFF
jgi:hypothetical protein